MLGRTYVTTMPPTLSSIERSNPPARRKACSACIRAKRRCNLGQPACQRCSQRRIECQYQSERVSTACPPSESSSQQVFITECLQPTDTLAMSYAAAPEIRELQPPSVAEQSSFSSFSFLEFDSMSSDFMLQSSLDENDSSPDNFIADYENQHLIHYPPHELQRSYQKQLKNLDAAFINHMKYPIDQLKAAPCSMVLENGTPWCHALLYHDSLPRSIQDVQACCGLYLAKNSINKPVIQSIISSRTTELISQPIPTSPLDLLARTHSLLLYSILQLFDDGDIQSLTHASQNLPALESTAMALLPIIKFPDSDFNPKTLALYPLASTREFWKDWIFQESARRTFFITFVYLKICRLVCGITPSQCDGKLNKYHSWTMCSARLWEARDAVDFALAWGGGEGGGGAQMQYFVTVGNFRDAIERASVEDVDDFAKIVMSGLLGSDEFKGWMLNRGGRL